MMHTIANGLATVHQIRENLWAVDEIGRTTMYLYAGQERVLLLDTGFGLLNLKQLAASLCPGREIVVVNTHAHGDHSSGNGQFDRVYVGRQDVSAAERGMNARETEQFREHFLAASPLLNEEQVRSWKPGTAGKTCPLQDGDVIDLGGVRLDVLETPGHTIGSISLWDRQHGLLFTGDMALTWCAWGHLKESAPLEAYQRSVQRLRSLEGCSTVLPSHGKADNPYGWPMWYLDPCVLGVYADGMQRILSGQLEGKPYSCFLGDGMIAAFQIGGVTYDPQRLACLASRE